MTPATALAAFAGLLLLAIVLEPMGRRLHLPFAALLVVAGFAASEIGVWLLGDIGLRWQHFRDLVLYVLLPVLVFESALRLEPRALLRNLTWVLLFAVPLMGVAIAITALLIWLGIGHPAGFPWIAALMAGVLLSATDPVAVIALFRELGAPARLETVLEGESLLNDAGAIVLFTFLVSLVEMPAAGSVASLFTGFAWKLLLGALAGGGVGALGWGLLRWIRRPVERAVITVIAAFFAFYLGETVLHASGIVAVLVAGILVACGLQGQKGERQTFVRAFWAHHAYVANALVFLLLGATITLAMFTERWLAMVIGIGAVLLARAVNVYGLVALLGRLPRLAPILPAHRHVLMFGGLRGAVTIALALSLPVELEGWWTVQSIAYGVVLFTLFVQAPLMRPLVSRVLR